MRKALSAMLVGCVALGLVVQANAGPVRVKTMASGLENPRGIAFAPNGDLYVVEMGIGGAGPCIPSPVPPNPPRCYGETGALTLIAPRGRPGAKRVVTGLPSLVLATGAAEGGAADVSFHGMYAFIQIGFGGNPEDRKLLGRRGAMFGRLVLATPHGFWWPLADVAAHEVRRNPAGGPIDSNPYGILALSGRNIVADAGANALIEVLWNGWKKTLAVLPPVEPGARDAVPTSVTEGPDGALYVSQLTGFPFWQGTASVWRVENDGSSAAIHAEGFTAIVDLAVSSDGDLYVLEIASGQAPPFPPPSPGLGASRLVRQCAGGAQEVLLDGLNFAAGVALGPNDVVYLTNNGTSSTDGEVLRVRAPACP